MSWYIVLLLPPNWVCLLVGVKLKDTTKPNIGRRMALPLAASKEKTGVFPKAVSPQQQNWGSFKLRVHAYSWRGLSRGEFSIELGPSSTKSKLSLTELTRVRKSHHHPLGSSWSCDWVPKEGLNSAKQLKKVLQASLYHGNRTGSLYIWFIFVIVTSLAW